MSRKPEPDSARGPKPRKDESKRKEESDREFDKDKQLDKELEDSFPASDPPSLTQDPN